MKRCQYQKLIDLTLGSVQSFDGGFMSSAKLAVIADDLTGACDTALQFAKCGLETLVVRNTKDAAKVSSKVDIITVDTESRYDAPTTAYEKVRSAVASLRSSGVRCFYKKIDSTLRGNIGSELDAMIDELGLDAAVISPSFPENQRITVGGYLLMGGRLIQRLHFDGEGGAYSTPIFIPSLIKGLSKRDIYHLNLSKVREGPKKILDEVEKEVKSGKQLIVADALTDVDLRVIAEAVSKKSTSWLPCGSAGLAEMIPEAYGFIHRRSVLVISGSVSKVSMLQASFAEKTLGTNIIKLNFDTFLERPVDEVERIRSRANDLLSNGEDVLVTSAATPFDIVEEERGLLKYGLNRSEVKLKISLALSEVTKKLIGLRKVSGLVLTGGETAVRVLKSLNTEKLLVESEVLPGIPLMRVMDGEFRGLRVVTKAGAFGNEEALVKIIKYLRLR
ncbi:MAG: four-carbon acid sugar kinase family protein [Candidatus Bathyarchaeia archaeon]